jgi:hypothetical protein
MADLMWHEFPFVDDDLREANEDPRAVVARLQVILGIATALCAAGWPLRLTLTGLSFRPPLEVGNELIRLGVAEPFDPIPSRTLAEVCHLMGELHDVLAGRVAADDYTRGMLAGLRWVLGQDFPDEERGVRPSSCSHPLP